MIQASRCGIQLYLILVGCQFFYESRTICHKFRLYTGFAAGRQPLLSFGDYLDELIKITLE